MKRWRKGELGGEIEVENFACRDVNSRGNLREEEGSESWGTIEEVSEDRRESEAPRFPTITYLPLFYLINRITS
ncbi:unnamed protein product [Allacma fusca]|uniref:Uncharacterized protein n=1 Tax=Allacma fusca TaxID=39272 RepID=A0A8J2P508_9HEXA|nr:unnamed protein product [Allacma fusca]